MHLHAGNARNATTSRVLRISLVVTLAYIVLLVIAGLRAHSLALLSEAGHNLTDFVALLMSWGAVYLQGRPPSARKTFGYNRAGVLVAFINGLSLVLISFYILYEAFRRLQTPVDVHAGIMIWVAAAGVVMNGAIALLLMRGHRDINLRSALLHEIGDTLSTAAVIAGGVAIVITGQRWIDPALSVGIGVMILWSSIGIIRESLNILLEGTPSGMELERIETGHSRHRGRERGPRPARVEHRQRHSFAVVPRGHRRHAAPRRARTSCARFASELAEHFHIHHTTIQFELAVCEVADGCVIPISDRQHGHSH